MNEISLFKSRQFRGCQASSYPVCIIGSSKIFWNGICLGERRLSSSAQIWGHSMSAPPKLHFKIWWRLSFVLSVCRAASLRGEQNDFNTGIQGEKVFDMSKYVCYEMTNDVNYAGRCTASASSQWSLPKSFARLDGAATGEHVITRLR